MSEEAAKNVAPKPRTMTSPMLKAMANPLRRRIFATLAAMDAARAADLADRLDVPANSLSFHLRVLAEAGAIEEAPELAKDRRDRVWRIVPGGLDVGSPEHPIPAEDRLALNVYLTQQEQDQVHQLQAVINWGREFATGNESVQKGGLSMVNLILNAEEVDELDERVREVMREIKLKAVAGAHDGTERKLWNVTLMMAREDLPGLSRA